jgi:hypothetical protein
MLPPHIVRFYRANEMEYTVSAAASPVSIIGAEPGHVLWLSYAKLFKAVPDQRQDIIADLR